MGFNEIIFMELRLIRMMCKKYNIGINQANEVFKKYKIYEYIESCYDILQTESDDNAFTDIVHILSNEGVRL